MSSFTGTVHKMLFYIVIDKSHFYSFVLTLLTFTDLLIITATSIELFKTPYKANNIETKNTLLLSLFRHKSLFYCRTS